jgi:short-subunit dehydrogenase
MSGPLKVFITGASSGIGAALAAHYARRGAVLGLGARRLEPMQDLARDLGAQCAIYRLDVTQPPTVQSAAQNFMHRFGPPDLVIANAGVSAGTLTEEPADTEVFRRIVDTNLLGLVTSFQPFIAPMRERGTGTLAGIASVAGFRGLPGAGAYSASKAGAISYLESLRVELRGSGVSVVTLCPGYIRTAMTERNPYAMPFLLDADEAARRLARAIDAKRRLAVIPWQMALVSFLLRNLPSALYDRAFAKAPRKPRGMPR